MFVPDIYDVKVKSPLYIFGFVIMHNDSGALPLIDDEGTEFICAL